MFVLIDSGLGFLWDFLCNKIFVEAIAQRKHIATLPTAWFMKKNICEFDLTWIHESCCFLRQMAKAIMLCLWFHSVQLPTNKVQLLFFHRWRRWYLFAKLRITEKNRILQSASGIRASGENSAIDRKKDNRSDTASCFWLAGWLAEWNLLERDTVCRIKY